jgi:DNA-binding transcriptional MerR regulator
MAMQIGELASRFGLNPKTIRYYEEIGLLPRPQRTTAGYRRYDEATVSRLGFILRAKLLGLSLEDIRDVLAIHERGERPCDRVVTLIDTERARIDHRIEELEGLRAELTALRGRWSDEAMPHPEAACLCPIIEEQTAVAARPTEERSPEPARRRGRATAAH